MVSIILYGQATENDYNRANIHTKSIQKRSTEAILDELAQCDATSHEAIARDCKTNI